MPWIRNRNIKLYYEEYGGGAPVLFFSGVGGGTWSWYCQIPYFKQNYKIILLDNRGAGKSDKPPEAYSMNDFAMDGAFLLDSLGIEKVLVVGVSMGGMIAQSFALRYPHRVKALVLGATHCGGNERIPPSPEVLGRFIKNEGLSPEEIIDKNIPLLFSANFIEKDKEGVERYKHAQLEAGVQPQFALENQLIAIKTFSCCHRLHEINVAVMVVSGDEDVLVPLENSRLLAKRISQCRLEILRGIGHAIHIESSGQFNKLVDGFFQGVLHENEA